MLGMGEAVVPEYADVDVGSGSEGTALGGGAEYFFHS